MEARGTRRSELVEAEAARPAGPARRQRVLVVDGDAASLARTEALLAPHHGTLCSARTAAEALAFARLFELDVALVDQVPGGPVDALALGGRLRALRPGLRLVMVSAWPMARLRRAARRAGFERVVERPLDAAQLEHALRPALRRRPAPWGREDPGARAQSSSSTPMRS